jgi:hypothetical protein
MTDVFKKTSHDEWVSTASDRWGSRAVTPSTLVITVTLKAPDLSLSHDQSVIALTTEYGLQAPALGLGQDIEPSALTLETAVKTPGLSITSVATPVVLPVNFVLRAPGVFLPGTISRRQRGLLSGVY